MVETMTDIAQMSFYGCGAVICFSIAVITFAVTFTVLKKMK